jgi:23S rRNA pseudouridine1911/1915/1917 synthase
VIGEGPGGSSSTHRRFAAGAEADGLRVDRFVCVQYPALGRAGARRLIEAGEVRVNGRAAAAGQRLRAGDTVEVALAAEAPPALADPDAPLCVVYEDAFLVCADKPAGMPAHPLVRGERDTLASALLARYPELAHVGYSAREPGIVHRLDTGTSGLMLAARDPDTFEALRAQLARGEIDKRYLALCAGVPGAPAVHEAWLSARGKRVRVAREPIASGELVRTELLSAQRVGASDCALVSVRVHVARRHQIRAHLAALGHAIAGDELYGGPVLPGLTRHFLHAAELHLVHPRSGAPLSLVSGLPADLQGVLEALERSGPVGQKS